jgi:8-amino-7-oxononanoate synthase
MSTDWATWMAAGAQQIRAAGRWRTIRDLAGGAASTRLAATGAPVVSFASNDYLGLSQHPVVVAAATDALQEYGAGAGASRLVVGSRPVHRQLEEALAVWKRREAALLFPTGYMANLGILTVLGNEPDVTIFSDELNHASIIDGARLARARVSVYRHGDVDHLEALLANSGRSIVVSDTVFSMDGDAAPVDELVAVCRRHGALLVLDDAHAVLGPAAPGGDDVVIVGTLSKTLGALGGFVAASRPCIDLLVNTARSFIFTTAPSPADTAAALAALGIVTSGEGRDLLAVLRRHVDRVSPGRVSPIVPLIIGGESDAVAASDALLARGLLVPAIRPPTVAPGTSRLRIALSAAHGDAQVADLVAALDELGLGFVR